MKKLSSILITAAALAPLFTLGLYSLFDKDPLVSEKENRMLKTKPAFTAEALFSGAYFRELSEYYADTFPYRDPLMSLNSEMRGFYTYQGAESSGAVLISRDGDDLGEGETVLDLVTPANETTAPTTAPTPSPTPTPPPTPTPQPVLSPLPTPELSPTPEPTPEPTPTPSPTPRSDELQISGSSVLVSGNRAMEVSHSNAKSTNLYASVINLALDKMPQSRIIAVDVPNSAEFYSSEDFHTGSYSQKAIIEYAYSQMNEGIVTVDAYSKLAAHTDEYIYFRTDHHWQALGAYYAYTAFCESLELEAVPLESFESGEIPDFLGSLYKAASAYPAAEALKNDTDTLTYYLPIYETKMEIYASGAAMTNPAVYPTVASKMSHSNKYVCFIGGDNALTYIHSEVGNGHSVIVLKESFGNAFVPFLTSHYEHVYVVDPRKVNGKDQPKLNLPDFVAEKGIEDVVFINYPITLTGTGFSKMLQKTLE